MLIRKKTDNLQSDHAEETAMELTERKIKKLPWTSIGVLLMHQAGIDLKSKMANATYYTHKRILAQQGFDITQPRKNAKAKD